MRIEADLDTCEGLGMCEAMADTYFEVGDEGHVEILKAEPEAGEEDLVDAAVKACPVSALKLA